MRRLIVLVLTLMLVALPAAVSAGGRPFVVPMTGADERPGPGDADGTGTAWLSLNHGQGEVCWTLFVENILLPAAAAHIHIAPVTDPGPVVVPLSPPGADGFASGCLSGVDQDLIKAIQQNPSAYYVNVHNADFPAGAVRGQLSK
jgi:hypothetical protein